MHTVYLTNSFAFLLSKCFMTAIASRCGPLVPLVAQYPQSTQYDSAPRYFHALMLLSVVCAGALGLTGAVLPGMSTFMLSATHQTTSTARPHSHGSHSVAWPLNPKAAQLDLPADVPQSRSAVPIAPMRLRHAEDATRTEKVPAPCHTAFPMVAFYTLKVLTIPLLWAIGRALAGARRARSAIRPEPRIALLATTGNAQDPYARVEEARVRAGKYDVEAVRDEIDTLVYSNPVVIFTQKNCGVCFQAIGLLNQVCANPQGTIFEEYPTTPFTPCTSTTSASTATTLDVAAYTNAPHPLFVCLLLCLWVWRALVCCIA